MEDKLKWRKLKEFLFGFLGFFLGTVIHVLLGYSGYTSRSLFGVTFVVIIRALYDIYRRFRYPEIIKKEKQLDKDERNVLINYKSSYIATNVMIFTLIIGWIASLVAEKYFLTAIISGLVIYITIVVELSKLILNKRM